MGMKALLIAVSDGLPRHDLASQPIGSVDASRQVAESLLPGLVGDQLPDGELSECCYPNSGVYVGTFGGTWLMTSQHDSLTSWAPTADDRRRNAYRVYMQSTVSLGGFSYWGADGTFREFYGTREKGLLENKGLPLPFERPFWAGDEDDRVAASFGYDNMPFHPMDLGDAALREFFGFVGEGAPRPDDLDAEEIFLHGFELISPPWRGGWFSRLLRRN